MGFLSYSQVLEMIGPYWVAPGETVQMYWYFPSPTQISYFPSLQVDVEPNILFTIEDVMLWTENNGTDETTSTNYAITVSNNAPVDSEGMVEVFLVLLSVRY
jgi:hypothetical protein